MTFSISLRTRKLAFYQTLIGIIHPKNQSDRTSFRNVAQWAAEKIKAGDYDEDLFQQIISYATEAAQPTSRNPAAVFISILKKELRYKSEDNGKSKKNAD